jgi:hypothetical protein
MITGTLMSSANWNISRPKLFNEGESMNQAIKLSSVAAVLWTVDRQDIMNGWLDKAGLNGEHYCS